MNHFRAYEHHQLLLFGGAQTVLKQPAQARDVGQKRHLVATTGLIEFINAANHHRAAVFHQHLGVDVLGVDGKTSGGGLTHAVFADVEVQNDAAVGGDVRCDFELQVGLAKSDRCGPAAGGGLVGQLGALLNDGLGLIGRDHPGLETTLPWPSDSNAEISRPSKRVLDAS